MAMALKPPNMLKYIEIYVDISYVKSFWTSGPTQAQRFRCEDEIRGLFEINYIFHFRQNARWRPKFLLYLWFLR